MQTKTCNRCGAEKRLGDFYACRGMRDGRHNQCRACMLGAQRACYAATRDARLARQLAYDRTPERKLARKLAGVAP